LQTVGVMERVRTRITEISANSPLAMDLFANSRVMERVRKGITGNFCKFSASSMGYLQTVRGMGRVKTGITEISVNSTPVVDHSANSRGKGKGRDRDY
jgi:hypothetical protein